MRVGRVVLARGAGARLVGVAGRLLFGVPPVLGAGARLVGVEGRLLFGVVPVLGAGARPVGVPGRPDAVLGRLPAGLLAGLRATGVPGGVRATYTSARSHSQHA